MASLIRWVGKKLDDVIPGDQSYLHNGKAAQVAQNVANTVRNPVAAVGTVAQQGGRVVQQAIPRLAQTQGAQQAATVIPFARPVSSFVNTQVIQPALATDQRVGSLMQGRNTYAPGLKGAGQGLQDAANIASVIPGVGLGVKAAEGAPLAGRLAIHALNGVPQGVATSVGADLEAGKRNAAEIARNAALAGAASGVLNAAPHVVAPTVKAASREAKAGFPNTLANDQGFIAGPKAAGFYDAASDGKTFLGPDNKSRFEVSDAKAKLNVGGIKRLNQGETETLGNVLDHKDLYTQYPQLAGVKVKSTPSLPQGAKAIYDEATDTIHVDPSKIRSLDDLKTTLLHENQHAVQATENTARGGLPGPSDPANVNKSVDLKAVESQLQRAQVARDAENMQFKQARDAIMGNTRLSKPQRDTQLRALVKEFSGSKASRDVDYFTSRRQELVDAARAKPQNQEAVARYGNLTGEAEANAVEARSGMNQKQLAQNPIDPFYGKDPRALINSTRPTVAAKTNTKIVENSLTKGAQEGRQNVSPEAQAEVSGQHTQRSTKELAENATQDAAKLNDNDLIQQAHDRLSVPDGKISDKDVAFATQAIERAGAAGRTADETALHDALSNHLVANGQTSQAAILLYRLSPQGMLYKAERDLKRAGVEVTDAMKAKIKGFTEKIKAAKGEERNYARAELSRYVANTIPNGKIKNTVSVWKAGLLSGSKTHFGNILSNTTFGILKKSSDPISSSVDKIISLATGKRTKTNTARGLIGGTARGFKEGGHTVRTGLDRRNITGDKYEQYGEINFKNPVVQTVMGKPANLVFRFLAAEDQPTYYAALKNNLYDLAKADGLNKGLRGTKLSQHMKATVAEPSEAILDQATAAAQKAVLGHDTILGKVVPAIKRGIDQTPGISPAGKSAAHAVVDVIAPFSKVPSAFLSRTVDFTPLGIPKTVVSQIAHKKFDQRALSEAIGEGATGTGIIALGVMLANSGQLSGDYPKDPKEQSRWKTEGITPNSVKLGDKWVSLNYLGPVGLLFNAGHNFAKAKNENEGSAIGAAIAGLGQGLMGQSFLQGFSGLSDAINDPARNASSFLKSEVGSLVPSWSNDIANATDSMQRQTNSVTDALKTRIPGKLREGLMPKIDAFGNELAQASGSANAAFNPLKPSNAMGTDLNSEIDRLHTKGQDVSPIIAKTIGTGDNSVKLSPEQQTERQKIVGSLLTPLWTSITTSNGYKNLSDDDKGAALTKALSDVNEAANRQMLAKIDSSKLTKAASSKVSAVMNGDAQPNTYISGSGSDAGTPKEKYQAAVDKYTLDKKAGKLNASEDLQAQSSLRKLRVTANYSEDVTDFYSLSKDNMNQLFKTDATKAQELYDKAKQLDSDLLAGGIIKTSKFKYGLENGMTVRKATAATKKAKAASVKAVRLASHTKLLAASKVKTPRSVTSSKPKVKKTKVAKSKLDFKAKKVA